MDATSLTYISTDSTSSLNSNKGHYRSRSLQSIISQTLSEFNSFNDTGYSLFSIHNINSSQISQVFHLNYTSFNNNNPILKTPNKLNSFYVTSDPPINNHDLSIPLEVSLSPFLSSENRIKKRYSLIYNGEAYNAYNKEEEEVKENSVSLSNTYEQEKNEGTSLSEILDDSLVSNSSIPSVRYRISFDANIIGHDNLLGSIMNQNLNLKGQLRNLKEQKNHTIGNEGKKKAKESCPMISPPLLLIPQNQVTNGKKDLYRQSKGSVIEFSLSPSERTTEQNNLSTN